MTNIRWRVLAVLFFATTINYIDRNVLSFVMTSDGFKTDLLGLPAGQPLDEAAQAHFKEVMGYVDACFKFAYAAGFLLVGWLMDRLGVRLGYAISIVVWTLASVAQGFAGAAKGLGMSRIVLGVGEAGNFPASIKTVSEWFPQRERSFATGLFNAGANMGIIVTAFFVPRMVETYGWRSPFFITGLLGALLLLAWWLNYRRPHEHPLIGEAEKKYIQQDGDVAAENSKPIKWGRLLGIRQTWAVASGKFLTDPIWWLYLTWLPTFFSENQNFEEKLDFKTIGVPFLVIYFVSDLGSIFFGWLSSKLLQIGWPVNRARKITMLAAALCVVPVFLSAFTHSIPVAVGLIALATAAHQGWSANMYTLASDMFPQRAVGSVIGIAGMSGAVGGTILAAVAGVIYGRFGPSPLFVMASGMYLLGLLVIHLLAPRLEKVELSE